MIEPVDRQAAMKPDQRIEFLAIVDRPKLSLPENKRVIAWPVVNVEEWDVTREMPRTMLGPPGGQTVLPDIPNWTWHEYGMRVGIWRMMDALTARQIKPTICVNAKVLETRPTLAKAMHQAGWEFMAHCYEQMHISKVTDQQAMIRQTVDVIQTYTGSFPAGWLGPGLGQTFETADYIAQAGFKWFADYVMDDLPLWVKTLHGPLLALPYTVELNDIPIMTGSRHESHVMLDRVKSALQVLHSDAVRHDSVRVICVSVHPYISGAAHRFSFFEEILDTLQQHPDVVFMTSEEIYSWYIEHDPPPKAIK